MWLLLVENITSDYVDLLISRTVARGKKPPDCPPQWLEAAGRKILPLVRKAGQNC